MFTLANLIVSWDSNSQTLDCVAKTSLRISPASKQLNLPERHRQTVDVCKKWCQIPGDHMKYDPAWPPPDSASAVTKTRQSGTRSKVVFVSQ